MILLVTGGRTFCEAIEGKSREDYMAERMALGFVLDMIGPSEVVCGFDNGAERWARVWCERRGVTAMVDADYTEAVVFPGGRVSIDIPTYEVTVK